MAVLEVFFSVLFIFSLYKLPHTTARTRDEVCPVSTCSDFDIRFPFRLRQHQYNFCGYPGFDLTCNNRSQTIINLPNAGRFAVTAVSYTKQEISINDPDDYCLPKRFLNFSLLNSPFSALELRNYTYYNCSKTNYASLIPVYMSFTCLNGHNYSVLVRQTSSSWMSDAPPSCVEVATVSVPGSEWLGLVGLSDDIRLKWDHPSCGSCYGKGGLCGFKSFGSLDTKCYNLPHSGLPRSAKYGIIIGVGIPGLICIIGLVCYICGRIRVYARPHNPNIDFGTSLTPQPGVIVMGLDKPTIESYPKTVLGESKRLPKPNDDGTCAICLCEYQPKETLRTIPECNHYFHAQCIDEWLRLNATCPLCRNTPDGSDGSSHVTPSSLSSLSPSSSSTSS